MVTYNDMIEFEQVDSNTKRTILTYSENLMSVLVKFDKKTETVEQHQHPEEQVTYVVSGRFKFFVGDDEFEVSQGDILRFEANQPHGCIVLEAGSELLDTFTPIRKDFLKQA